MTNCTEPICVATEDQPCKGCGRVYGYDNGREFSNEEMSDLRKFLYEPKPKKNTLLYFCVFTFFLTVASAMLQLEIIHKKVNYLETRIDSQRELNSLLIDYFESELKEREK